MIGAKRKAESGLLATEDLVQQALREAEAQKAAKKQQKDPTAVKKVPKGKTLGEIEADEGGVVKESLVGMAHTKRAAQRKQAHIEDAELVGDADLEAVEEQLEVPEDEGVALEPFNLEQERREGFFDEDGHYVEKKDEEEKDAWLASGEAEVVSERVRRQIAERQRAMAAAEAAPEMSGRAAAELKRALAELLLPGETVTAALRRLRPAPARLAGRRGTQKKPGVAATAAASADPQTAAAFERVTEAASALMDSGELDVYSQRREDFERAAALFAPVDPAGAGPSGDAAADDMFAESDDEAAPGTPSRSPATADPAPAEPSNLAATAGPALGQGGAAAATGQNGSAAETRAVAAAGDAARRSEEGNVGVASGSAALAAPSAGPAAPVHKQQQPEAAPAAEADGYADWPVKELRRFLTERGHDLAGIVDKVELVAKVREVAAAGPEGEAAPPPAGYTFDTTSGLYADAASGMYYDGRSGGFYSSATGLWYSMDAGGQYVAWPVQAGGGAAVPQAG